MNSLASLWTLIATGSLRASVLIAIVFVLRWALRGRVPAQCFHWLWILVAIRLLLPVAPGSATSIFNLYAPESPEPKSEAPAWIVREEAAGATAGAAFQPSEGYLPSVLDKALVEVDTKTSVLSLSQILTLVWLAGVLLQIALLGRSALRMARFIRHAKPITDPRLLRLAADCAQRLGVRCPPAILESSVVAGPALVGLWRPRLVVPYEFLDQLTDEEARFVLLHECAHLRRRDLLSMWLLAAARVIHWFNPLAWLAVRVARIDMELACDETLLRCAGAAEGAAYGETLLKLTQLIAWRRPAVPVVAIAEGKMAMRLRIEAIASFSAPTPVRIAAALAILLGTSLVFAVDESAKSVGLTKPFEVTAESELPTVGDMPEWARDWSVIHVLPPAEGSGGEIVVRTGGAETKMLENGKTSDSGPWLETLESIVIGGQRRWKATLRRGNERVELLSGVNPAPQVEIQATFIETNDTVIRRLRLNAKKGGEVGLRVLDDALRGRETNGVLTPEQGGELLAALTSAPSTNGLSGLTVLAGPRVTTKSGNRAVIEIIREFRYPTDWLRDEQKQIWVPKTFETRNTGVTLEAEPVVTPEGEIILQVTPQVVEFLGWKNVDTGKGLPKPPVKTGVGEPQANARASRLLAPMPPMGNAQNPIWRCLPVFSARKLSAGPVLQSGETLIFANLPEAEDVAPFKSPAASTRVVVLVTARVIVPPLPSPPAKIGSPPSSPAPNYIPDRAFDEFLFGAAAEKKRAVADAPPALPANLRDLLPGISAPGDMPGFIRSPYAPNAAAVDVRGLPPGTEVKCPTTGRRFIVPAR